MNAARTYGVSPDTPAVTFWRRWEVLMRYSHVVDATQIAPIWFELSASYRDDLCPTLEDVYRATAHHLRLIPPFITHGLDDVAREVRFAMGDYTSLAVG